MGRLTDPIMIISALRDISISKTPVCLPEYCAAGENGVKSGITIIMKKDLLFQLMSHFIKDNSFFCPFQ